MINQTLPNTFYHFPQFSIVHMSRFSRYGTHMYYGFYLIDVLNSRRLQLESKLRLIRKVSFTRKECKDKEKAIFNLYDRFISNEITLNKCL